MSEWISVKDMLPEEQKEYLVTDGVTHDIGECDGMFFYCDNVLGDQVTHWMPLPKLPKE